MSWVRAGLLTSFIVTAIVAGILLQQPGRVSASDDQSQHWGPIGGSACSADD